MTPEQYNYEREMDRRTNLTLAEAYMEMAPILQRLVMRWAQEDAESAAMLTPASKTNTSHSSC